MQTSIEKITLAVVAGTLLLVAGIWWGGHPSDLPPVLRNAFVSSPHSAAVDEALADIEHDYYRRPSAGQLANNAIAGAVAGLEDPYADYQTPQAYRDFAKAPPATRFGGVGVDIVAVARGLEVDGVIAGSPAAHAGIRHGDLIVAANDRPLAGHPESFATDLIRGKIGTTVTLTIERGTRRFTLTLTRALIAQPPVQLVTGAIRSVHGVKVAVIALATFDVSGIHTEVADTLKRLLHDGAKAIVLDLRDNGGGLVREAQLVASLFIRHGVIVTTRGRAQPTVTLRATGHPLAATQPMAVLVNRDTASAAEIVTGALQDDHRATVVGTRTYGKGVFQEVLPLPNGGAIAITVGQYYLPNGTNLGRGGLRRGPGIKPNVTVTAPVTADSDPTLAAALVLVAERAR
jgi:carboxyl-terminal processing protease